MTLIPIFRSRTLCCLAVLLPCVAVGCAGDALEVAAEAPVASELSSSAETPDAVNDRVSSPPPLAVGEAQRDQSTRIQRTDRL